MSSSAANPSSFSRKAKSSAFLINGLKIVKPESLLLPLTQNISNLKSMKKTDADNPPAKAPAKNPRIQPLTFLLVLLCLCPGTITVLGPGAWAYTELDCGAIAGTGPSRNNPEMLRSRRFLKDFKD